VDVPVCRVAPGDLRSRLERRRVLEPYEDLPRCLLGVHDPNLAPIVTFLVSWGHLLIGLSLLVGLMVRVSAAFGIMLMLLYWLAHMDFPYIENTNNFIVDYHIVYASILGYLIYKHAGYVWGLDRLISRVPLFREQEALHLLVA
jgi:thiosulfate dehydrogenase (quinone) large subunit